MRSSGGWRACSFILVVELLERFSHHGIASNLVSYLTRELHLSTATAAKDVNNFQGTNALVPIVGGFFADAYLGRYATSLLGCIFYVIGLMLITLAVSLPALRPPPCLKSSTASSCEHATPMQLGVFFCALYITSLGLGATNPCFEAFGADQFEEKDASQRQRKSSFFNWWFFAVSIGGLFASTVLVYIEDDVSWGIGFGIPCGAMFIATLTLLAGTRFYIRKPPGGSPLTRMAQVLVASIRKRHITKVDPARHSSVQLYELSNEEHLHHGTRRLLHTRQFRFLDKAAVIHYPTCTDPWRICSVTQVEEVKLVLRIVPVVLATLVYGLAHAQATTLFTRQGSTLNRRFIFNLKIAPASLQLFSSVASLITVPLYDKVLVPAARKITGDERGISLLQRIGVGMFLTTLCMAIAACTEMARLKVARDNGLLDKPSTSLPMSVFWLVPQYVLVGVSNVFTVVGKQEFFYDQVPDTMRSLGMAVYLLTSGAGAYLSSFLISIVEAITKHNGSKGWFVRNLNRCHLDYFYWLLAILSLANLFVYVLVARRYTYKRAEV